MSTYRIILIIFLLVTPVKAAQTVFVIEKPITQIAYNLAEDTINNLDEYTRLMQNAIILASRYRTLITDPDIRLEMKGLPHYHYYYSHIYLAKPYKILGYFDRKVEIWAKPKRTIVRITISFDTTIHFRLCILEKIKNRIVARANCIILNKEVNRIRNLMSK